MRQKLGIILVYSLSLIPAILWLFIEPLNLRFFSPIQSVVSAGQLLSLFGMSLFAINFILSARLGFLESIFGGLNKIYINHHRVGLWAFLLLLAHPVALSFRYFSVSTYAMARFFLPDVNNLPVSLGIFSLLTLIILIIFTLYVGLKYNHWKISHKFMSLAFVLGFLHMSLISSDVSRNMPLRVYMFFVSTLAIMAMLYRPLFGRILARGKKFIVSSVEEVGPSVTEITFSPVGKRLAFLPGQFVFVRFSGGTVGGEQHPFSISSAPQDDELKIAVKKLGDYTSKVKNAKPGDKAYIEGPFGNFSYRSGVLNNGHQIWVAGGIGITPFLSMARDFDNLRPQISVDLYCGVNDATEAVFIEELESIAARNESFRVFLHESKGRFWLDEKIIRQNSGPLSGKEIFICGPPAMMSNLRNQFVGAGVNNNQIHSEEFSL